MHPKTIFTKTPKGILEVKNKTIRLPRDLGLVFLAVDGKSAVADLPQKAHMDEASLARALDKLLSDGYIWISYQPLDGSPAGAQSTGDLDLDFTSPTVVAQLETEARVRAQAEAEAKARAEAAARAAAAAKARQESEAQAHAAAQAKAKAETEAKARAEAAAAAAAKERVRAEAEVKAAT